MPHSVSLSAVIISQLSNKTYNVVLNTPYTDKAYINAINTTLFNFVFSFIEFATMNSHPNPRMRYASNNATYEDGFRTIGEP